MVILKKKESILWYATILLNAIKYFKWYSTLTIFFLKNF